MRDDLASRAQMAFERLILDMGVPPDVFAAVNGSTTVTPSLIRNAIGHPEPNDGEVE